MKAINKRGLWGSAVLQHAPKDKNPLSDDSRSLKKNLKGHKPGNAKVVQMSRAASAILLTSPCDESTCYEALLDRGSFSGILPIEHPMVMAYIASCQPDYCLIYVSPQIVSLGFTPDAWLAETDLRLQRVHEGDFDRVSQALLHSHSTGEKFNCFYRFYDNDGKIRWLHDEASVVCDESGAPLFICGVMLDITEQKEMEAELHEHRYCLERQVELKTDELLKRLALLESCNVSLCDKLALAYKELATIRQPVRPTATVAMTANNIAMPSEEISDRARSMMVCRVAAAGAIS